MAIIVIMNRDNAARVWFWPGAGDREIPTLLLMVGTAAGAIVAYWILLKTRRVLHDVAELRAQEVQRRNLAEQEHRRHELDEQEKRIDQKLKKALDE